MINERIRSYTLTGWSAILRFLGRTGLVTISTAKGTRYRTSIIHRNIRRTFNIYLPPHNNLPEKPLVIVLHGRGANGESMELLTRNGFNKIADTENFIVVYPDGAGMTWNDGRKDQKAIDRAHLENIDDVGFISALIDLMIKDYGACRDKVFVTGLSNGAIMAYRLACELSERIAAVAPVDGNIPRTFCNECRPAKAVSLMAVNNTLDPLVPYEGGVIQSGLTKHDLGKVISTAESIRFWVQRNNCNPVPDKEEISFNDSPGGLRVSKESYHDGTGGTEVVLVTIHGGGHTWPGGVQYMPERIIGKTCRNYNATEEIWSFFKEHSVRLQEAVHE